MRARGFTLVELIVAMILIGVLAIAVVPRMSSLRGFDEIGFRDQVRAALEYARKSAVAQRRNVRVSISGNVLTLDIASDIPEGGGAATFNRSLNLPGKGTNQITAPSGVSVTPDATIVFTPLGQPSSGGTWTVSGAGAIILEAETGYVH